MLVHKLIWQRSDEKVAFYEKSPITYKEFQAMVAKYRDYLFAAGISPGEVVGLLARNSAEFICSYMAVVSLGAIVVPINFQLTAREIAYIAKDACMKNLITADRLKLENELNHYGYKETVAQHIIGDIKSQLSAPWPQAPDFANEITPDHPCAIIYTSGTTGHPKGAVLTHRNLLSNAMALRKVLPVPPSGNVLCVLPMYHCFAWTCAVLNPLLCGASVTILESFNPKETIAAIKEYGISVVYGVPPMYNFLSRVGEAADLAGVEYFVSGGAPLPEKIAVQFAAKYGANILEGYGLSEASPVVTINPPRKTKVSSIGQALPGLDVKIVNSRGEIQPPGIVGELTVNGPSVMKEYFNLPLETAAALKNGRLHTGDLAYQDAEGYYYIVDRLKDMIISSGENIYPREIEELLYAYPGIIEAAVIGLPDELRGQSVCAHIVLAEGQAFNKKTIKEYLHNNLAGYKVPRDIIAVDALPKNPTGKILKRLLREQHTATDSGQAG